MTPKLGFRTTVVVVGSTVVETEKEGLGEKHQESYSGLSSLHCLLESLDSEALGGGWMKLSITIRVDRERQRTKRSRASKCLGRKSQGSSWQNRKLQSFEMHECEHAILCGRILCGAVIRG